MLIVKFTHSRTFIYERILQIVSGDLCVPERKTRAVFLILHVYRYISYCVGEFVAKGTCWGGGTRTHTGTLPFIVFGIGYCSVLVI